MQELDKSPSTKKNAGTLKVFGGEADVKQSLNFLRAVREKRRLGLISNGE